MATKWIVSQRIDDIERQIQALALDLERLHIAQSDRHRPLTEIAQALSELRRHVREACDVEMHHAGVSR